MKDFVYLLQREQEELLRAQSASCSCSRSAHQALARGYARRIGTHAHPYRTMRRDGSMPFDPAPYGIAAISPDSAV